MKREKKIEILKAIQSGKMRIEELTPESGGIFVQISTEPSIYEGRGRTFTEAELNAYLVRLKDAARNIVILKIDTRCEPINISY